MEVSCVSVSPALVSRRSLFFFRGRALLPGIALEDALSARHGRVVVSWLPRKSVTKSWLIYFFGGGFAFCFCAIARFGESASRRLQAGRTPGRHARSRFATGFAATMPSVGDVFMNVVAPVIGLTLANMMFFSGVPAMLRCKAENSLGDMNPGPFPVVLANSAW